MVGMNHHFYENKISQIHVFMEVFFVIFLIQVNDLPCGNFSYSLPYNASDMSWIYVTLTYIQPYGYYGYDFIKMYVMDGSNSSTEVVTLQIAILESPCQNKGSCQGKMIDLVKY